MSKNNNCWRYCTSVSFMITGVLLTVALHKQENPLTLLPPILIFIGIALHVKIMRQDYREAFRQILKFLMCFALFLVSLLCMIGIQFAKKGIAVISLTLLAVVLLICSIRYFLNISYILVCHIKEMTNKQKSKMDFTMWTTSLFAAFATIFSVVITAIDLFSRWLV